MVMVGVFSMSMYIINVFLWPSAPVLVYNDVCEQKNRKKSRFWHHFQGNVGREPNYDWTK